MSYNNIFNPLTNEFVELNTSEGVSVLKNYVSYVQNGGAKKPTESPEQNKTKTLKQLLETNKQNRLDNEADKAAKAAKVAAAAAEKAAKKVEKAAEKVAKAAEKVEKALEERRDRLERYNHQQQQLLENGLLPQSISDENDIDFYDSEEEQDS